MGRGVNRLRRNASAHHLPEFACAAMSFYLPLWWVMLVGLPVFAMLIHGLTS